MPTILVVEDETVIAEDLHATLAGLGYDVLAPVASATQAIRAVEEQRPDLVLMDIQIQGALDGIRTAEILKRRWSLPVVYLTSFSDDRTLERAKATEPHGFLLKPFEERELKTTIDVALHKHALETHLAHRERWFATTLRSIADAVVATDADRKVTFMNRAAEELTGLRSEEASGRCIDEVVPLVGVAPDARPVDRALRDRVAVELAPMTHLRTRDGAELPIDCRAAPLVDEHGELLGAVVVFRDVTERQRLANQVAIAERLAALGTLAAGMGHEINNPLAATVTNVAFATETLDELLAGALDPALAASLRELRRALSDATAGADRVRAIVQDLRPLAQAQTGRAGNSTLDLGHVMELALKVTSNTLRHHARVRTELGPVPLVAGDAAQLTQLFTNVLLNAAEAIGDGDADHHEIVVSSRTDARGRAVVEVRDSGPGIPPALRRRIFDPFFTTKPVGRGMGLGLSIAHSIVSAHGGDIEVESVPGRTIFRVTLPAVQAAAPAPVPAVRPRGRVLVIDDEPSVGSSIRRLLRRDHEVESVTDARVALARIEAGERFDTIVCDLMMPSFSGIDLFHAVERVAPDQAARVVFLTGGAFTARSEEFLRETARPTIVKPFGAELLRETIARVMLEKKGNG